jgi:hypothetical protein
VGFFGKYRSNHARRSDWTVRFSSIENVKPNQVEIQFVKRAGSVGYLDDNFAAPVRGAFEHLMSLARLIEPQDFADFGF